MGENILKNKQWGREDFSALKKCKKSVKNEKIGDNFQILCYNSRVYCKVYRICEGTEQLPYIYIQTKR